MAGQIQPRKAIFAKDRYYVELTANPEKDHSAALRLFVAALEKSIAGGTTLPEALSAGSPRRNCNSLRLVPESVLGLRALKRGYAAEYEFGKAFVVTEESPATAAAVMEKLRGRIGQTSRGAGRRRGLPGHRPLPRPAVLLPQGTVSSADTRMWPMARIRLRWRNSLAARLP